MKNKLLQLVEQNQIRKDLPNFNTGDNVKVHLRIKEENKERIQIFEGLVIAKDGPGKGLSQSFKVRKISSGIGVEKDFPLNSPIISAIEVIRRNKVRRKKLYYIRNKSGKSARLKEKK
ncbi:50S RIBOSOMAL PROTEIN L19 [Mycoplasmopsis pulmonis]|uniref:Large ribosomal subunit protein bL19 n=1 Tax=Mycoplasmopsis pulmonis (strain UAB CTIP) TaxID=272635 RepID=RL19_MYCPU|nr:50S ribosomal protein L19 [Mycoplasmopsis pulmonis]Q98Q99.1 RecName: Full=Large ribosomal subunit protein bL19; AltName: Full=50S ribosomal protein L19 [Mycoplasmopsis pulmonis UAB CTIP]MDZ7293524.1 50S ribosomal protein L19 [Mycoplasmopsis pulmonis]CAC13640.1 50S RIBOSOMAL PROTEIN L19 [Mycoplasmopsis pulmonis]VEU68231.1 50S ribosomal protein L19 [Mycoplasmopsis pulmonis]